MIDVFKLTRIITFLNYKENIQFRLLFYKQILYIYIYISYFLIDFANI